MFKKAASFIRSNKAKAVAGFGALVAAGASHAALDLTAVQTSIEGAGTQGTTVGGYVIAAVATLVVIGVVLAIVRKI